MKNCIRINRQRGSGMVLGLFVILLLFTIGISFLTAGSSSLVASKHDMMRSRALACAEAGVDKAIYYLMNNTGSDGQPGNWRTDYSLSDPNTYSDDCWLSEHLASGEDYYIYCRSGTGINTGKVVITSEGTVTEAGITISRTVKVVVEFRKENVNVWNNVIFGGVGQAGKSINGNVVIRGSMHLLGDGEPYTDLDGDGHWDNNEDYTDTNKNGQYDLGEPYDDVDGDGHRDAQEPFQDDNGNGVRDPALTVTDLAEEISGTANVGNNYNGMPLDLRGLLPEPPQVSYGGESVESLSAKLRVKHGKVSISGSATVGDVNIAGNSTKETLDGTYVNDGFGGNKGVANVSSDNGYANKYDLAEDLVDMPIIDYGSYTKDGATYSDYLNYIYQHATVYTGNISILKGCATNIVGPYGSLIVDKDGNMTITGTVYVTGGISFGPSKTRLVYSGNGTLVTPGCMDVHCDIVPKTNFPNNDVLGLVAGDKIDLAMGSGDAHLTMAIAMYAQHQITCGKQSDIAGTIVASYYSMANVPRIYQVPELANHLPPFMPGSDPIWIASVSIESWQDIPNPL